MKKFRLTYTMTCDLTAAELWPDGDIPDDFTAADVEALIKKVGGWVHVLSDWNLDHEAGEGHVMEVEP